MSLPISEIPAAEDAATTNEAVTANETAIAPSSPAAKRTSPWLDRALTALAVLALLILAYVAWGYWQRRTAPAAPSAAALPAAQSTLTFTPQSPTPTAVVDLPPYDLPALSAPGVPAAGVPRMVQLHTTLPDFSAFQVRSYEVKKGDTLYAIADQFKIKPQTIMWGNADVFFDNPDFLSVGAKLRILPVDGALYRWAKGDGLNGVAKYFKVAPEDIIGWPTNNLNADTIGSFNSPNIAVGTVLLIPGGVREFRANGTSVVTRKNPGVARIMGAGFCGTVTAGVNGTGTFVWPSTEHSISGYTYDPGINHYGIDVAGQLGNPVYAADSGVIVYAGWNDYGYGNMIIIDHGNGWQTLYGHLSVIGVNCGQSVMQGGTIGNIGSTGRSTGPHLHFEMSINGAHVSPLGYVH